MLFISHHHITQSEESCTRSMHRDLYRYIHDETCGWPTTATARRDRRARAAALEQLSTFLGQPRLLRRVNHIVKAAYQLYLGFRFDGNPATCTPPGRRPWPVMSSSWVD
ncbi:hypothetical protein HBB16_04750 [Pseudonocardia sp. MCCB 268]|nr:hypothetical protein [Pseudonocardia cytotoxica]